MLLKALVYADICIGYSSRRIGQLLKRGILFMWLAGMCTYDHDTVNRFCSDRLKGFLKDVFTHVVQLLASSGHIGLKDINIDGTKKKPMPNATVLNGVEPLKPVGK